MESSGARREGTATIDVVVPVLDERDQIVAMLESLFVGAGHPGSVELDVVVVDGGSRDGTPERAASSGARVIKSAPGRAQQLQTGLEATAGDVVVFVHADTCLPAGWADAVLRAIAQPSCVGGAFQFSFALPAAASLSLVQRWSLRSIEKGTRLRSRWLGLPYGDQALFALRGELAAIGGLPRTELMEDLDLVARLRRRGRLALLPLAVKTSPRRHLERGIWRTAWQHSVAAVGWRLGVSRSRLRAWLGR